MRTLAIVCTILFFITSTPAAAQFNIGTFTSPDLAIELAPQYPRPGETVTATINDYRGGTYGSSITWVLNGEVITAAANQRQTVITAGDSGETQTIEVLLTKPTGGEEVLRTSIKPLYLDIIVEPQTHVPSFYDGRSLPSIGSQVNATAVVSDPAFTNPDLVYTWRINQQVIEGGSVRNRNQVSFTTPMGSESVLSVQATDLNGNTLGRRSVLIPSVAPKMHFYEVNALFGMREIAITDSLPLISNSVAVRAEPYYLDSRVYNNPTISEWSVGGITNNGGGNPYEITLQRAGGGSTSLLEFHVRDTAQVLQGTKGSVRINL